MANQKVAIFDFDGTLVDTAPLIVSIYNKLAQKSGWRVVHKKDLNQLRLGGLRDAQRWAGIHWWQYPKLIMDGRKLFKLEVDSVKLFSGVADLVRNLKEEDGYEIYVLSRNKKSVVDAVLDKYGVNSHATTLKSTSFFGGKHRTINKLVESKKYRKSSVWMIGDETRDIEAAKRAKVNSIAVTWGLQDESVLRDHLPTHVAHSPKDVREYLKKEGAKSG
jgi:phosphoglycolate phosphatase-like HAD superfamily hydrolase